MFAHRLSRLVAVAAVVAAVTVVLPVAQAGATAPPACTKTFTNTDANGSWNDANNWSPSGIPGSTDVACMTGETVTATGTTVTVGAVNGGALTVDTSFALADTATTSELDALTLAASFIGPTGSTLDVDGDMTWGVGTTGAQFDNSGGLDITQSADNTFDISGSGQVYDIGGTVSTSSPVDITDADLIGDNVPTIETTSTITISPQTYAGNGGGGLDLQTPAFVFTGSTVMPDFNLIVTGTTSSFTGTDTLSANLLTVNDGGTFSIPSGDAYDADSNSTINGTLTGAGTFACAGTTTIDGTVSVTTFDMPGGTATLDVGGTLSVGAMAIDGGTLWLDADASTGTFSETSGALNAGATAVSLSITGAATWSGGQNSGTSGDVLTLSQGAGTSFTISGTAQAYLIGDAISSASPISITSTDMLTTSNPQDAAVTTTSTLSFGDGVIVSQGGGVFSAAGLTSHTDTATYGMDGDALTLTGGSTTIPAGATFEACDVNLTGGSLRVDGTISDDGCGNSIVSGGTLSGTGEFSGYLESTGSGVVEPGDGVVPGSLTIAGSFTSEGTLTTLVDSATNYSQLLVHLDADIKGTIHVDTQSYTPPLSTGFLVVVAGTNLIVDDPTVTPAGHYVASAVIRDVVVTAEEAPSAPSDAMATPGNGVATVSFTAPSSDGGATISTYTVTATDKTTPANGGETCQSSPPTTECVVDGLTNGDQYTFTVTATNADTTGAASSPSNAVTPAADPNPPTDVTAAWGTGSSTVSWTPPVDDGGAAVTQYVVTATDVTTPAHGGQTCQVNVSHTSKNQCTVTGLTNGDEYTYSVTAVNTTGASDPSTSSTPTYPSAPPALTITPARLVLPHQTYGVTTCRVAILQATSCTVVVTGPKGVVIAHGSTTNAGASSLTVRVNVTPAGGHLAAPVGGVTGTLVATVVLTNGETLRATGTLQLVEATAKITLAGDVTFASGSSKVSAQGRKIITALGKSVKGSTEAECDGYTDNVGTKQANLALGLARAKAVCSILAPYVKHTKVVSYGEADPVATNGTPQGRAKNRRVVIKITN